jgi:membrane protein implicated in regulation of membrane protease activity
MKCNVGGIDRTGRIVLGIVLLLVGLFVPALNIYLKVLLFVIAAIALVTAVVRFCPANALLGIDSCKDKDKTDVGGGTAAVSH